VGKGIKASIDGNSIVLGSAAFIGDHNPSLISYDTGTHVHVSINHEVKGKFSFGNQYRKGIALTADALQKAGMELHVLSGDNNAEQHKLLQLFGHTTSLQFRQSPQDKLGFIQQLQDQNKEVLMMGDGLNDAGALQQSNVGISVSDNTNRFSPACDAILDGSHVGKLHQFLGFARSSKKIITLIFIISILYNIVGLYFATQALLSPMIAAIIMPISSISIVLLATLFSNLSARRFHL
jgi:Cu+-exporting ATPase